MVEGVIIFCMSTRKQLGIGALLSYFSIFLNIAAGLIYIPWMVNQIGPSDYGLYTLSNSLISLFLVDFGLSAATSRYVSKYRAEGNQEKVDNFMGAVYKLYLLISAVIFVVLTIIFFLLDTIYVNLSAEEIERFKVVYLISAGFSIINFPFVTFNGVLNSYEKFIQLKVADIIYRIIFVVSTVLALYFGYGLYALVTMNAVSGLIVVLYKYIVIKATIPMKVNFRFSEKSLYKSIFAFSIWATVATLAQRLIFNITPSVLGIVADSYQISIFGIVITIESYVYLVINAINGMFIPKISKVCSQGGENADLNPLLINVGRYQYSVNGLILAGFVSIGNEFITLWMGEGYVDAYICIVLVLLPGLFFNSLEIAHTAMVVQKKMKQQAFINMSAGLANIALSFPLSYWYGAKGACISIFIAYSIKAIVYNVYYHKRMQFNILAFSNKCYVKMSLPIIVSIICGLLINRVYDSVSWLGVCIKGAIIVFVYMIVLVVFCLEKDLKKKLLGKFIH